MSQRLFGLVCGLFGLCGCLTAPVADELYSSYVLPPNAEVPALDADEAAAKKLAANAALPSFIPLRTGYFNGTEVQYWDFGELTSINLKPMYIFRYHNQTGDGIELAQDPNGHPNLIDAIPGDTAYTPLRQIYAVDLTSAYRGERITSIRALEDAVDMGLAGAPVASDYFTNCLVVPSNITMQTTEDGQSIGPEIAYYKGKIVKQFCVGDLYSKVGAIMLTDNKFKPGIAIAIRRRSDAKVLDETLLDSDLNDDGDLLDTNTIFNDTVGTKTYSGIWSSFEVQVDRNWKLGDATKDSDLFDRDGDRLTAKEKVLDFRDRGVFLNRPIRWIPP